MSNFTNILESIKFKTEFIKALSKELKNYGFRNSMRVSKQIREAIQHDTISYSRYESMFRSILKTSKDQEWDIQSGKVYKIKNYRAQIPLKKKNPFFKILKKHSQGSRYTEYKVEPLLQDMLNTSWSETFNKITLPCAELEESDFTIPLNDFILLPEKQKRILQNKVKGSDPKGSLIIKNNPKGTYRKFSTFTRINQKSRDLTEFSYSYDISVGLQSLMLNFYSIVNRISFEDTEQDYPLLYNYCIDKTNARTSIAKIHNCSLEDVKTLITSITYGGLKQQFNYKTLSPIYTEFYKENKELSDFIVGNISTIEDDDFHVYLDEKIQNKEKNKSLKNITVYTFMEYYEKRIRDILIEHLPLGARYQEVHDAVYSTKEIDIAKAKQTILQDLNFVVEFD